MLRQVVSEKVLAKLKIFQAGDAEENFKGRVRELVTGEVQVCELG